MQIDQIGTDDMIGAVRSNNKWRFFAGILAEWIMDYASYDPYYKPSRSQHIFRNGLLFVNEANIEEFCNAMSEYELAEDDIIALTNKQGATKDPLVFVIDCDNLIFINGLGEIDIHRYVPVGWKGYEDDPMNYVPDNVRRLWKKII